MVNLAVYDNDAMIKILGIDRKTCSKLNIKLQIMVQKLKFFSFCF